MDMLIPYVDFPKLPVTVENFDAWIKANPDEAIHKEFIRDKTYNADEISELLLKAHWREDAWRLYAQSSRTTITQLWKIITQQFDELNRMRDESDRVRDARKELRDLLRLEARENAVIGNKLRADREHERWKTAALCKAKKDGKWRPKELAHNILEELDPKKLNGRPYSYDYILKFIRRLKTEYKARCNA